MKLMTNKVQVAIDILFFVIIVSLASGITSLVLINKVSNTTENLSSLRKETNVANCISGNVTRKAIREDIKTSLLALVPPGVPLTEEQQARIVLYNEGVDRGLPYRDCSPKGIATFIENPPPDPALEQP